MTWALTKRATIVVTKLFITIIWPTALVKFLIDEGAKPACYYLDSLVYDELELPPPLVMLWTVSRWTAECAFVVLSTLWTVTAVASLAGLE